MSVSVCDESKRQYHEKYAESDYISVEIIWILLRLLPDRLHLKVV